MTLPERLREVATWAIGAIDSGGQHMIGYLAYIYRSIFEVARWNKFTIPDTIPVIAQFISPLALGGYGLVPFHGLVSGLSSVAINEGIRTIGEACFYFKSFRPIAKKVLSAPPIPKNPLTSLRSPGTVTFGVPHLTEHHLIHALEEHYIEGSNSVYLKSYLDAYRATDMEGLAREIFEQNPTISETALNCIYQTTPLYFIDRMLSKVKKSTTLTNMLGKTLTRNLKKRIQSEAERVRAFWDYTYDI
jgi:hypothetical protein